jgi:hypothetical protein
VRQPGLRADPGEHVAQPVDGDPLAVVGEQEVCRPAGPGVP